MLNGKEMGINFSCEHLDRLATTIIVLYEFRLFYRHIVLLICYWLFKCEVEFGYYNKAIQLQNINIRSIYRHLHFKNLYRTIKLVNFVCSVIASNFWYWFVSVSWQSHLVIAL